MAEIEGVESLTVVRRGSNEQASRRNEGYFFHAVISETRANQWISFTFSSYLLPFFDFSLVVEVCS